MKQPSLKISVLIALILLQCAVYAQVSGASGSNGVATAAVAGEVDSKPIVAATSDTSAATIPPVTTTTTSEPASTATQAPAPATVVPPPTTTTTQAQTTNSPVVATSSSTENPAVTSDSTERSHGARTTTADTTTGTTNASAPTGHSSPSASSSGPTSESTDQPNGGGGGGGGGGDSNKTATIAGSVVGGVVGIALIAGLLTCLNRRGGCTSRTRRRDIQQDFEAHDNEYGIKMTDNHTMGAGAAAATVMHATENQAPSSPFQHARRFVPPTSNPTGYMNLTDEEYGYHQQNTNAAAYQPQGYQDYNNASTASEYDYQQHSHQGDYSQQGDYPQHEYRNEYPVQQEYAPHEYVNELQHEGSVAGSASVGGVGYQQGYYNHAPPGSNVTSPTLTNSVPVMDNYHAPLKPDQIEQKPNAA